MSKQKVLLGLLSISILVFFGLKFYTYSILTSSDFEIVSFGGKITTFYEENLRLPMSLSEFDSFISRVDDAEYYNNLHKIGYRLLYDSTKNEVSIYTAGMDWDDDELRNQYSPGSYGFFGSLFKDGDVLIQKIDMNDLVQDLKAKAFIMVDGVRSNDLLFDRKVKLIIFCILNMELVNDDFSNIQGTKRNDADTGVWIELISLGENITLRFYGGIDQSKMKEIEENVIRKIRERQVFERYKEVRVGVHYDTQTPPICLDI